MRCFDGPARSERGWGVVGSRPRACANEVANASEGVPGSCLSHPLGRDGQRPGPNGDHLGSRHGYIRRSIAWRYGDGKFTQSPGASSRRHRDFRRLRASSAPSRRVHTRVRAPWISNCQGRHERREYRSCGLRSGTRRRRTQRGNRRPQRGAELPWNGADRDQRSTVADGDAPEQPDNHRCPHHGPQCQTYRTWSGKAQCHTTACSC